MRPQSRARALLVVTGLLLLALVLGGQGEEGRSGSDRATGADAVLDRARELYTREGPEAALPSLERALGLYRQAGDRRGEAITLGYLGNCYKRFGELSLALEVHEQALAMKRELGDRLEEGKTLSHVGLVRWEMGDYPSAIRLFQEAIAIGDELGDAQLEGSALNNLSLVYDELGDYTRSLEQYERALELYRRVDFPRGEGDTLGNIGGVHLLLGQYREALGYYRRALAISERLGTKVAMSQDHGNSALCHLGLGEVAAALEAFDRALVLAREAGLSKEEADWQKGKAEALLRVGRYDEGLEMYRTALAHYEAAGLKRELVEALSELGVLHTLLGDVTSAEEELQRSLALAREIAHPRGVSSNLLALGDLESRRQRYEPAAALYREARDSARAAGNLGHTAAGQIQLALTYRDQGRLDEALAEASAGLATTLETGARLQEANALYVVAEIELRLGRQESALRRLAEAAQIASGVGEPDLGWRIAYAHGQALEAAGRDVEALAQYRRAADIIESVRDRLREERFRAGYIEDKVQVYVALVRLLIRQDRVDEAFQAAEKLRARSYLDLFNRGLTPAASGAERQEEAELRQRIRQLQRSIEEEDAEPAGSVRQTARQTFASRLAAAEREYQNFLDDLRRTEPARAAVWGLSIPSAEEVRRSLSSDEAILEYVVGRDELFVFVLTNDGIRSRRVPLSETDLSAKVELLRALLMRREGDAWLAPAASLSEALVSPIEEAGWLEGKLRLHVAAHGSLHYLPFGVLPRQGSGGGDSADGRPGRTRLLVEDYVLSYVPSAGMIAHAEPRRGSGSLLALAPTRARLAHAPAEAERVARHFPDRHLLLLGDRATEEAFKQLASRYRVLHLATHGSLNRLNPLLTALELERTPAEDGRLEVHEILDLRIEADLVTLSACDTALGTGYFGQIPAGDDFVGLTRAFLSAGARVVAATLWEVDDRLTVELMDGFYRDLGEGSPAAALTAAQRRAWRRDGAHSHPYYWAPFVLVGTT